VSCFPYTTKGEEQLVETILFSRWLTERYVVPCPYCFLNNTKWFQIILVLKEITMMMMMMMIIDDDD